ncbi:MAG TPA: glycosyltransferase [Trueperaceae bacterium]
MILLSLAALDLLAWLVLGVDWMVGTRRMGVLEAHEVPEPEAYPSLSVVVPARNEERTVEAGVRSLLAQDYPMLQLIVVNDRSTDRTGAVLERLAAEYPALTVVHVRELPDGWLGKNHALYLGAKRAVGEWLLFTDADVQYAPGALRATVAYALSRRLDHLAALPRFVSRGVLLTSFVTAFALLFSVAVRPWAAGNPRSPAHIGIGAFGLLRRSVYRAIGTHRAIALRPDDDVKLGKLVKTRGYRQAAVFAPRLLSVEWYESLPRAIRGLNKNAFAGFGYSLPVALVLVAALVVTNVLPFVLVFVTSGPARWLSALVLLVVSSIYAVNARFSGTSPLFALLHPVASLLLAYAALEATFKTLWRGGIDWRGTFYPLRELRKAKV